MSFHRTQCFWRCKGRRSTVRLPVDQTTADVPLISFGDGNVDTPVVQLMEVLTVQRMQKSVDKPQTQLFVMPIEVQLQVPIVQSSETSESPAKAVKQAVLGQRASSCSIAH